MGNMYFLYFSTNYSRCYGACILYTDDEIRLSPVFATYKIWLIWYDTIHYIYMHPKVDE